MNITIRSTVASCLLGLLALLWAPSAMSFDGFDDGGGAGLSGCADCHASLANLGPGHSAHSTLANNDCNACHGSGSRNNPPLANCVRCHGRDEDAGSDGVSAGLGLGLRQHHVTVGAAACQNCHSDAVGTAAVGENVLPSFYAAALGGAGLDSCDGSEERFASRSVSLDNDGDGLTDDADPDCASNQAPTSNPNGPYSGSVGSSVSFDGTGSTDVDGAIVAFDWTFGDGSSGSGIAPTHTYLSDGTFTVTLTVTDDGGATDSASTTATITAQPLPPIADVGGPYSGLVGTPISFDGTGSTDPDGTIVSYAWDFGDGGTASGATAIHTFSVDGTFTVSLTVTDSDGLTSSDATSATINQAGGNVPPVANANGPYPGTEGVPVQFSSEGSTDSDGTILTYAWDFGDGSTSTAANPTHTYVAAGTYSVSLTVTDDAADSGSDVTSATIEAVVANAPPVADANGPYAGFVGESVAFDGSGSSDTDGTIVRYDWNFGDGATAMDAGPVPSHAYSTAGSFTVTLTVTDDAGASDSATAAVDISEQAAATDGETQYNNYCASCHGDPWVTPAVDPALPGVHRVAGSRACSIDASIFGTYVFPNGVPEMQFLQAFVDDGTVDPDKLADYLNSRAVTGEQYYASACFGCHGENGQGGRVGESVTGDNAAEIREAIDEESTMRFLACLPDSDIEATAAFLGGGDDGHTTGTTSDDTVVSDDDVGDDEERERHGGGATNLPMLGVLSLLCLLRLKRRR